MIVDDLSEAGRYAGLPGRFDLAFDYLRHLVGAERGASWPELKGDKVWSSIATKPARRADGAGFEYHERCADVHLCLRGEEQLGWRSDAAGLGRRSAFSAEKDFGLYDGTPECFVPLRGLRFAIFFPGELHAPFIGQGELTKVCVKVRIPTFL